MKIDAAHKLVRTVHDQTGLPLRHAVPQVQKKKSLSRERQISHINSYIWNIYTTENYSAIKRNEIIPFAAA